MAYNAPAAPEAMAAVAAALDVPTAAAGLQDLVRWLDGPTNLHALGFRASQVEGAAELATTRSYPNPRPVTRDGVVAVLTRATVGGPPG